MQTTLPPASPPATTHDLCRCLVVPDAACDQCAARERHDNSKLYKPDMMAKLNERSPWLLDHSRRFEMRVDDPALGRLIPTLVMLPGRADALAAALAPALLDTIREVARQVLREELERQAAG